MIYVLIGIIIVLCILLVIQTKKAKVQVEANRAQAVINMQLEKTGQQLRDENLQLQQEKEKTENQLSGVKTAVQAQQNILKSLTSTNETMRAEASKQAEQIRNEAQKQAEQIRDEARKQQDLLKQQSEEQKQLLDAAQQQANEIAQDSIKNAEAQAQEAYEARVKALAASYEQKEQEYKDKYDQVIAALNKSILAEKGKLEDLEAKQQAYYEAQKRAQEIEEQADYYRLLLTDYDISDIYLLRDLQMKFTRKDVIDKMIWETYYRPAFDVLTGKLCPTEKMCGIYKITCLKNQATYIGQSVDIKERWRQHIKSGINHGPTTNRLYQEMYKQGPENFTFEILEEVPREKLNERESYWIEFYKTKEVGLNGTKGNN